MKKLLLLSALLLLALGATAQPAPEFEVFDTDGQQHNLYDDYLDNGKVVVVEMFFVNCPPCAVHAPYFQTLYQAKKYQYPGKVEFFLMTILAGDHDPAVAQYKQTKNLTMPCISADGNAINTLAPYQGGQYGPFFGTPTFFVIAPGSGAVFFDVRGYSAQETMDELSHLIDQLVTPAGPSNTCAAKTPANVTVSNVQYTVETLSWDTTFTAASNYSLWNFPSVQGAEPYEISASKNDLPAEGISTLDLVLMSKHILNIAPFTTNWQKTAADVNNSGAVTAFDIVETRKLLLGIYNTFPDCPSWKFDPPEQSALNGYCAGFQAIKMGDVNSSYNESNLQTPGARNGSDFVFSADDRLLEPGRSYRIDLRAGDRADWSGVQLTLGLDPAAIRIDDIAAAVLPGFGPDAFNAERQPDGFVPLSWVGDVSLSPGDPVFSVQLTAKRPVYLSEALYLAEGPLPGEGYDLNRAKTQALSLNWRRAPGQIVLSPNPAETAFQVSLEAEEARALPAQLFDDQGRLVFAQTFFVEKGANRFVIRPGQAAPGVYCLILDGRFAGKVFLR